MTRSIRYPASRLLVAIVLAAVALARPAAAHDHADASSPHDDPDSGIELIGRPAPPLKFDRWARGGPLSLADLRGRVVLMRFWTEKCRYCETTLPALESLRTQHANDGLVVIAAYHPSEPGQKRSNAQILAAADSLGFGGPIACDESWRTLDRWWLKGHPDRNWVSASFLVDREGIVRWVHGGGEYHASEDPRHARCEAKLRELEAALERALAHGRAVDSPIGPGSSR